MGGGFPLQELAGWSSAVFSLVFILNCYSFQDR